MKPKQKIMFQQFGKFFINSTLAAMIFLNFATVFAMDLAPPGYDTSRQLGGIFHDLEHFKKICGRYPTTEEGLSAFSKVPQNLKCRGLQGKTYIDTSVLLPKKTDGYGQPIKYTSDGTTYRVQASHGYYVTEKSPARLPDGRLSTKFPKYSSHWDNPDPPKEDLESHDGAP
jgi:Type II secretion system (T2SS), protein G